jgi:hypothetical protein
MNQDINLQAEVFSSIKKKVDPDLSLADEIAHVLGVSSDSAYRRIRGEKQLSCGEMYQLANHYHLSLDSIFKLKTDTIQFTGNYINPAQFRFEEYLHNMVMQTKYMLTFKEHCIYYLCKDIPIFYQFFSRELAAFKYYFWHKTLLHSPEFVNRQVKLEEFPDEVWQLGRKTLDLYKQLNVYEIWNIESLNGFLRQIEFYHDTGIIESPTDLLSIYESLEQLFIHVQEQAQLGYTFDNTDPGKKRISSFHMYFNEVVIGDNSLLVILDGNKMAFVNHTLANYMITTDVDFCENLYQYHQNLMKKCTQISSVSDRERSKFFNFLRKRIAGRKEKLAALI